MVVNVLESILATVARVARLLHAGRFAPHGKRERPAAVAAAGRGPTAGWFSARVLGLAALLLVCSAIGASAQTMPTVPAPAVKTGEPPAAAAPAAKDQTDIIDPNVEQASCPTCGSGLLGGGGRIAPVAGCASCGWGADCGVAGD